MKIIGLYILFVILAIFLVVTTLTNHIESLLHNDLEIKTYAKSKKSYLKRRKIQIPLRSIELAQNRIKLILEKEPIYFEPNSISLEQNSSKEGVPNKNKVTLKKILNIVNHLEEDAILVISTHTDTQGAKQHNLKLSQKRADILKSYFRERCTLPLIVAMGYGEELPFDKNKKNNGRVVMDLKRIK